MELLLQFSVAIFYTSVKNKPQQNSDYGFFGIREERMRKNGRKE